MSTSNQTFTATLTNFANLVSVCQSLGAEYQPSRDDLRLESLQAVLAKAQERLEFHQAAQSTLTHATSEREEAFKTFGPKITRIHNALKASKSATSLDEKAAQLVRKIRGDHKTATVTPAPSAVDGKSSSPDQGKTRTYHQATFDSRVEQAAELVKLLSDTPEYQPNETDLKLDALHTWISDLTAKNSAVTVAEIAVNRSRQSRDQTLVESDDALYILAKDCKAYIRSAFGAKSAPALEVGALHIVPRA